MVPFGVPSELSLAGRRERHPSKAKGFSSERRGVTEELHLLVEIAEQLRALTERLDRRVTDWPVREDNSRIHRIVAAMGAAFDEFDERVDEILSARRPSRARPEQEPGTRPLAQASDRNRDWTRGSHHGPHHASTASRPRRRERLRRARLQHQQHGAGPGDHGGGRRGRRPRDHPGQPRRPPTPTTSCWRT